MKRAVGVITAALLLVGLIAFAGCGGSTNSSSSNKTATGELSEAELGVPIYPGAKEDPEAAGGRMQDGRAGSTPNGDSRPEWNGQGSAPGPMEGSMPGPPGGSMPNQAEGSMRGGMTVLWTQDSVDKVTAWYREELSGKSGFSEGTPRAGASSDQQDESGTIFSFKSGDTTKTVMIREDTRDKGGTVITVGDMPEGMSPGPPMNQSQ